MAILALQSPVYQPAMRIIAAISNSFPALITTTFDHDYLSGTIVRLVIPPGFGITVLNQKIGTIEVVSPLSFLISLDSTNLDTFMVPTTFPLDFQHAQVVPVGSQNDNLRIATKNVLGS